MKKLVVLFRMLVLPLSLLLPIANAVGKSKYNQKGSPNTKIFIKNGDVWVKDKKLKREIQISYTKGMVRKFLISKGNKFVAYEIGAIGFPDCWGTDPDESSNACKKGEIVGTQIVIFDLQEKKVKKVLDHAAGNEFRALERIELGRWISKEKLQFETSGQGEAWSYLYDTLNNQVRPRVDCKDPLLSDRSDCE